MNNIFKYSFVISIDDVRYDIYKKIFTYFNLPLSERINFKIENQEPIENCGHNHLQCIKLAKERNYPYCLILEDDAYPRNDILEHLNNLKIEFDIPIDILHIGCYSRNSLQTNIDNIYKCNTQQGSHSYIVYKCFYDKYIELVENDLDIKKHIDFMYKYTNNSYLYKYRLFEQYTPSTIKTNHIHYSGRHMGKFVSENLPGLNYEPQYYTKIL